MPALRESNGIVIFSVDKAVSVNKMINFPNHFIEHHI